MHLIVVRHGRTAWNAERRFQGHADIPLDEEGRAQARALAAFLHEEAFDYAVSSDLARARETAQIILSGRNVPLVSDARWREMRFGTWEGLTWEEIVRRYPQFDRPPDTGSAFHTPPGGESFEELCERVEAAVRDLTASMPAGARVLLATHAGVLHALLRVLEGALPREEALGVRFTPASVTRFSQTNGRWKLHVLNQTPP